VGWPSTVRGPIGARQSTPEREKGRGRRSRMRKVFRISYEKAYEVREGLYYAVPHYTYGVDDVIYRECGHHDIVVDKGGKVWLYDLAEVPKFPEEDWVVLTTSL
jgi:hypothetical protein